MANGTPLQEFAKMRNDGYSMKEIAEAHGTNIAHVSRVLKKYEEQKNEFENDELGELENDEVTSKEFAEVKNTLSQFQAEVKSYIKKEERLRVASKVKNLILDDFEIDFDNNAFEITKDEATQIFERCNILSEEMDKLLKKDEVKTDLEMWQLLSDYFDTIADATYINEDEEDDDDEDEEYEEDDEDEDEDEEDDEDDEDDDDEVTFDLKFKKTFIKRLQKWAEKMEFGEVATKNKKK